MNSAEVLRLFFFVLGVVWECLSAFWDVSYLVLGGPDFYCLWREQENLACGAPHPPLPPPPASCS